MKKIITLFLIFFISSIYAASSLKTFEIDETEKLSLGLKTDDPDADVLIYTFTEPLDDNGEWQTTYGDAGEYNAKITVSDGMSEVSEDVLIIVNRKEEEPIINSYVPKEDFIDIEEGINIKFKVDASDLNEDELIYKWLVNDEVVSDDKEFLFETGYDDDGEYNINVIISDGTSDINKEWNVNVKNADIDNILNQIEDVSIIEGETVSLKLPDFERYGLSYEISEPLGNKNKWITSLDDDGEYIVKITAEGKGFKRKKVASQNNAVFINTLIDQANNHLNNDLYSQAVKLYPRICFIYQNLSKDTKAEIHERCVELHKRINNLKPIS